MKIKCSVVIFTLLNPLAAEFFSLPFRGMEIFFTNPHLARTFFVNVYCSAWTFIFGSHVFWAEDWSSTPSTYRVSVYTLFLKQRARKFNFCSYVLNLVKINISCCLSKVGSPGADLLAFYATSSPLLFIYFQ